MLEVVIDSFFQEKGLVFQQLGFGAHQGNPLLDSSE
jgi:hypothetical protein